MIKFLLLISCTLVYGESLIDEYKKKMNGNISQATTKTIGDNTLTAVKEIEIVKILKKEVFESTNEFSNRVNRKLLSFEQEIKFYIANASKEYSAGTIEMTGYNPDTELMTLAIKWNQDIRTILPQCDTFKKVVFSINREEAKQIFSQQKKHYFHIRIKDHKGELYISKILFTDKYVLYSSSIDKQEQIPNANMIEEKKVVICKEYNVIASKLYVRENPTMSSLDLGVLSKDDIVCVYEFYNGWAKIKQGWVNEDYLKIKKVLFDISTSEEETMKKVNDTNEDKIDSESSSDLWWLLILLVWWILF